MKQNSQEWHEFRKTHIGASDMSVISGLSPYKTTHELWEEKTGKKTPKMASMPMLRGLEMEPQARAAFEKERSLSMMPAVMTCAKNELFSASLDGVSFDGKEILEIKCPMRRDMFDLAIDGIIEPMYDVQVQWQLMVSKAKKCYFFVYHPEWGTATIVITPDKEKQKDLVKVAKSFWELVINNIEPEKTGKEYAALPDELQDIAKAYLEADARIKLEEGFKKACKEKLCAVEPGNYRGHGISITWSAGRATVDWEALCEEMGITDDEKALYTKAGKPFFTIKAEK